MIGKTLGDFQIDRELGKGGMGAVYLAHRISFGQRVALKVLLPELSGDQSALSRFLTEAHAAAASDHPGIIKILDMGMADGSAYIAMEFLDGESLATRLEQRGRLSVGEALTIMRQVLGALSAAHNAGVIHRDLKPDNIFLVIDPDMPAGERAKILDFGISKVVTEHGARPGHPLTVTGVVMGTPYYMSPEQCRGRGGVDARSDLYALGCIFHELLTGQTPFQGLLGEVIGAHQYAPPPRVRTLEPTVPAKIEALIQRLLAKEPDDRPPSAAAVLQVLDELEGRASKDRMVRAGSVAGVPPRTSARDTTLSAARGETMSVQRRARRRTVLGVALGAVGVGALAVAAVFAAGGGGNGGTSVGTAASMPPVVPDAHPIDAPAIDARVVDAAPPTDAPTIDAALVDAPPPPPVDAATKVVAVPVDAGVDAAAKVTPPRPPPPKPPDARDEVRALLAEASSLLARGQYKPALEKAEKALVKGGSATAALRIRGLAACELGYRSTAADSAKRLRAAPSLANEVIERCKKRGITL